MLLTISLSAKSAITYDVNVGGRLGDHLLIYCKAKWISYKYDLSLFYKPFTSSTDLLLHQAETYSFKTADIKNYDTLIKIKDEEELSNSASSNNLYESSIYFRPFDFEHKLLKHMNDLEKKFILELKKLICPMHALPRLELPQDAITVAVHVRKGSGHDKPLQSRSPKPKFSDRIWPLKFPPDQYYIDQIKKIAQRFKNKKIYVFIFTDHKQPKEIAIKYQNSINNPLITFDYRRHDELKRILLLQDFFDMTRFDCLIRGDSNFSKVAQIIGNHSSVYYPKHGYWLGDQLIIDEVGVLE